ncbi:MAG: hypothetical protein FRX48_02416 [Lasallia pustulata]|uniref:Uncharacterized protein n=1 Tax=Lasallia pustulata TaxID=136370 RepID=A0A5M8PYA2_9LECA|nr:MAG: hypothetical protein FRX48_02416 [Lasallia pustulata]
MTTLSLAVPVTPSSLAPRGRVCANSHSTAAGTLFHHRSLKRAPHNAQPGDFVPWSSVWCVPNTRTYVVLTTSVAIAEDALQSLLTGCPTPPA